MHRTLLAVALTASFATAPSLGFLEPLWSFLASFAAPQPTSDIGCGWDPWGCPKNS